MIHYMKIFNKVRNDANDKGENLTDAAVQAITNDKIDALKKRMPFKISVERDSEDKEKLLITSVEDKNGEELPDNTIEIHIQSLGADEQYWLDSGAFEF